MTSNTALQPQKHQLWKNIYILNQLSSCVVHLIWILIWIKVTWVSMCNQCSFGTASRKTNGHSCNWFERFRNQSIITWWCWQTIKKGKNVSLSRAHRNARHLQVILEWKWQRLESYVYQKQLELCKQSVSDSACVVGSTKIQSPVLMKCHAFAFFSINQSENAFESELELCDFALQQRMAGPAVNRSACSTGEKFCLPCGVWRCFFIFQHAVCTPLDLNLLHRRVQGYSPNGLSEDICISITPGL